MCTDKTCDISFYNYPSYFPIFLFFEKKQSKNYKYSYDRIVIHFNNVTLVD